MLGYADYVFTTVFTIEIMLKVNLIRNRYVILVKNLPVQHHQCINIFVVHVDDSVRCVPSSRLLLQKCFQSLGPAGSQRVSDVFLSAVSVPSIETQQRFTCRLIQHYDLFNIYSSIHPVTILQKHPLRIAFWLVPCPFCLLQFECHLCGQDFESVASAQTSPSHQPSKGTQGTSTIDKQMNPVCSSTFPCTVFILSHYYGTLIF